jgi:hypothetical protein
MAFQRGENGNRFLAACRLLYEYILGELDTVQMKVWLTVHMPFLKVVTYFFVDHCH